MAGAGVMVQAGTQAQPADQVLDLACVEAFVQVGCVETLGCEPVGDRGVPQALAGQSPDPRGQRRVVGQLVAGSVASLAANVAVAEPSLIGRVIAAWPSFALTASYELLTRQVRRRVAQADSHDRRSQLQRPVMAEDHAR